MEGDKDNPINLDEIVVTPYLKFDYNSALNGLLKVSPTNEIKLKESVDCIMASINTYGIRLATQASYILATTFHETAETMLPIKEYGSDKYLSKYDTGKLAKDLGNTPQADGDGIKYAGRGYVMITGRSNYEKFSRITGIDLLTNPDFALHPKIAALILVHGMVHGTFTGKKLSNYINKSITDYIGARKVINGSDKSQLIAKYAAEFEKYII